MTGGCARAVAALAAAALAGGCLMPRYLAQAAHGQLDLMTRARPIEDVIDDPSVPIETRLLLEEVVGIKAFGAAHGLDTSKNYKKYVEVPGAAVWFVGASRPLAFQARRWCFPIAGCFTGLGWFEREDAIEHREQLRRDGWDAMARPAGAYSTGGWFPDPIVSSMIDSDVAPYAELANVLFHESVHATVLVPDQMFFNEGLAEAVGDALTDLWLVERFGPDSAEQRAWTDVQAWRRVRTDRQFAAYQELDALYESDATDDAKRARKAEIFERLRVDLGHFRPLNNAHLIELRLYKASYGLFQETLAACGGPKAMLAAAGRLGGGDFAKTLDEELAPVLAKVRAHCDRDRSPR